MIFRAGITIHFAKNADFGDYGAVMETQDEDAQDYLVIASDNDAVMGELHAIITKTVQRFAERRRRELNIGMCYTWLYSEVKKSTEA